MAEEIQLAFYMCIKDGGPLCERDVPIVFEDGDDATDVLHASRDEEAIVAELKAETIVHRLRGADIKQVFYKPAAEPGFVMDLDTFTGKS